MATEIIGLRRLYDSIGCGLSAAKEVKYELEIFNNGKISIYIGPTPTMGVVAFEQSDKYYIPGKAAKILKTIPNYLSECFLEICISFPVVVEDKISRGLKDKDENAKKILLEIADQNSKYYRCIIDTVSGIIGLKIHRQFVLKLLVENTFIASGPEPISSYSSDYLEMLEELQINKNGQIFLSRYTSLLEKLKESEWNEIGQIFQWLLKAWQERDNISKFIYLFIPLECILGSSDNNGPSEIQIQKLVDIVNTSNSENKEELLSFLDIVKTKFTPNLVTRFETFAKETQTNGWEADVSAFKKFNRMRNLLLHEGNPEVKTHIDIDKQTVIFEDLVERYLSLAIFHESIVYSSRWRPVRK